MKFLDPTIVLGLLKSAAEISGYPMPDLPPPQVIEATHKEMMHMACHDHECNPYGFYRDNDVVVVDAEAIAKMENETMVSENSVIVHELTHHLQYHNGEGGFSCHQAFMRERQAYHVQNIYMFSVEGRQVRLHVPPPPPKCVAVK